MCCKKLFLVFVLGFFVFSSAFAVSVNELPFLVKDVCSAESSYAQLVDTSQTDSGLVVENAAPVLWMDYGTSVEWLPGQGKLGDGRSYGALLLSPDCTGMAPAGYGFGQKYCHRIFHDRKTEEAVYNDVLSIGTDPRSTGLYYPEQVLSITYTDMYTHCEDCIADPNCKIKTKDIYLPGFLNVGGITRLYVGKSGSTYWAHSNHKGTGGPGFAGLPESLRVAQALQEEHLAASSGQQAYSLGVPEQLSDLQVFGEDGEMATVKIGVDDNNVMYYLDPETGTYVAFVHLEFPFGEAVRAVFADQADNEPFLYAEYYSENQNSQWMLVFPDGTRAEFSSTAQPDNTTKWVISQNLETPDNSFETIEATLDEYGRAIFEKPADGRENIFSYADSSSTIPSSINGEEYDFSGGELVFDGRYEYTELGRYLEIYDTQTGKTYFFPNGFDSEDPFGSAWLSGQKNPTFLELAAEKAFFASCSNPCVPAKTPEREGSTLIFTRWNPTCPGIIEEPAEHEEFGVATYCCAVYRDNETKEHWAIIYDWQPLPYYPKIGHNGCFYPRSPQFTPEGLDEWQELQKLIAQIEAAKAQQSTNYMDTLSMAERGKMVQQTAGALLRTVGDLIPGIDLGLAVEDLVQDPSIANAGMVALCAGGTVAGKSLNTIIHGKVAASRAKRARGLTRLIKSGGDTVENAPHTMLELFKWEGKTYGEQEFMRNARSMDQVLQGLRRMRSKGYNFITTELPSGRKTISSFVPPKGGFSGTKDSGVALFVYGRPAEKVGSNYKVGTATIVDIDSIDKVPQRYQNFIFDHVEVQHTGQRLTTSQFGGTTNSASNIVGTALKQQRTYWKKAVPSPTNSQKQQAFQGLLGTVSAWFG